MPSSERPEEGDALESRNEHSRGTASAKALRAHRLWGVQRGWDSKCGVSMGRGVRCWRWREVRREDRQGI